MYIFTYSRKTIAFFIVFPEKKISISCFFSFLEFDDRNFETENHEETLNFQTTKGKPCMHWSRKIHNSAFSLYTRGEFWVQHPKFLYTKLINTSWHFISQFIVSCEQKLQLASCVLVVVCSTAQLFNHTREMEKIKCVCLSAARNS